MKKIKKIIKIGDLFYTDDYVPIRALFVSEFSVSEDWIQDEKEIKEYFQKFGPISDLNCNVKNIDSNLESALVTFETAESATKALNTEHRVFHVCAASSRYQPDNKLFKQIGELSYTEDSILIYTLYVEGIPRNMDEEKLKTYFEKFGAVVSVSIVRSKIKKRIKKSFRYAFVRFESPESATKVLNTEHELTVSSADSWKQPFQKKLPELELNLEPNANAPILHLNDDCLLTIFENLTFSDQIHLSSTCVRMQNVFVLLYKTRKCIKIDTNTKFTLMNFRKAFIKIGVFIDNIKFTSEIIPTANMNRYLISISRFCPNLQTLDLNSLSFHCDTVLPHLKKQLKCLKSIVIKNYTLYCRIEKYLKGKHHKIRNLKIIYERSDKPEVCFSLNLFVQITDDSENENELLLDFTSYYE